MRLVIGSKHWPYNEYIGVFIIGPSYWAKINYGPIKSTLNCTHYWAKTAR